MTREWERKNEHWRKRTRLRGKCRKKKAKLKDPKQDHSEIAKKKMLEERERGEGKPEKEGK